MKSVCIVKTSALGDIVQTFTVLSYLKQRLPHVNIDWVVEAQHSELVKTHPFVRHALSVDTTLWRRHPLSKQTRSQVSAYREAAQRESYDVVFDLQGNLKSGLLTSQFRSAHKVGFSWATVPEWPNLLFTNQRWNPPADQNICADYLYLVQRYFQDEEPFINVGMPLIISGEQTGKIEEILKAEALQGGPKILVSPGSAWRNKEIPIETLSRLLQRIAGVTDCRFLFSWGSDEERQMATSLHQLFPHQSVLLERYPLAMLQNLMRKVDLVIAMDSLPLHLAASAGAPTFAFFGPSSAKKYNPPGKGHAAFQGTCPYGRTFVKRCPVLRTCPTGACLREQPDERLFESFRDWWEYEFRSL